MPQVSLSRRVHFSAAHRLAREEWSDEENRRVFGECAHPNWHGHNYEVVATVKGLVDPDTGYVIDMKELKEIMSEEVVDRYDHRNLNLDVEDFQSLNPTAENIVGVIWNRMRKRLDPSLELTVTLFETERNFVEYDGQ